MPLPDSGSIGTGLFISKTFMILVDRLGTRSAIRKDDSTYGNRAGYYEMAPLYMEPFEVLSEVLGTGFRYFGFSDTIIAVAEADANVIGAAASKIFAKLLGFSLASRVFISYGDFSFHRLEDLGQIVETFVCPIYGSTLLDAHEMEQRGIKCLGVFVHGDIAGKFATLSNVAFSDGADIGVVDLRKYLSVDDLADIQRTLPRLSHLSEGAMTMHCETLANALAGGDLTIKTNGVAKQGNGQP